MITHDVDKNAEQGVGTLVSGIITDVQQLLTQHLTLFQQELHENVTKLQSAGYPLVTALSIATVAGVTLSVALALLLHDVFTGLPTWACFGLVGLILFSVAVPLVRTGKKKGASFHPASENSAQAFKEDIRCLTRK